MKILVALVFLVSMAIGCGNSDEPPGVKAESLTADDLDLPWVGEDPSGPEFLFGEIPLKTRLGCVGNEEHLYCQPADPSDIALIVGTVTENGVLLAHEVVLWHD